MKKALVFLTAFVVTFSVFAVDYTPVTEEATATISGTQTFSGANTFTSTVTTSGLVVNSSTATSLTNGAVLTPTAAVHVLTGTGGANDTTNTVTIADATDGQLLTLIVSATSTNLIGLADSGNLSLSSAWVGDNNDAITLRGVSTNWVEVSASDN